MTAPHPGDTLDEQPAKSSEPKYGDEAEPGDLLTLPDADAAKAVYKLWKDQPQESIQRRRAQWQVNQWRREGRTNCYVQKTQDQNRWQAWAPPYSAPPIPLLNKAARLCRRLASVMFADPPVPECEAGTGDEEDQDSAQFAERVLQDVQGEGQLDDVRQARRAFDRASVYGSGFIRYYIDDKGGGLQPVRIMAKPGAVTADTPFTGPNGEQLEGDLITRYAMPDGSLTDNTAEAATQWVPSIKSEPLSATCIRYLPYDAEDLWDCDGIVLGTMRTWGELQKMFPDALDQITDEDKQALFSFKPDNPRDLLGFKSDRKIEKQKREDDNLVAVFTVYYKSCPDYPNGCYIVALGDKVVAHKQEWIGTVEGTREELDIPVTQYQQFDSESIEGFGAGLMELLGGGNEIRAAQVGHLLAHLDQFTNRKVFIPTNSILQPKSYQLMQGSAIPINPGGEPKFEEIPEFPSAATDTFTLTSEEMDDQSTMQQTAQGTENPSVQSGVQASIIVAQSQAGASDLQSNTQRAYIRGCRIQLQLIRTGYTIPQQISWTGDDGQYRQKYWTGSDLKSAKDVKLKKGSLSMMSPPQKLNLAIQFQQLGAFASNPDQFYEILATNMGSTVGLQDDPFRQRIKRQLAEWSDGPPEGWMPQVAPVDPVTGQPEPAIDPATGQPAVDAQGQPIPAPAPPDPALGAIFAVLPADELQDVATIRLGELKRFMASTRYTRWPREWRAGVDQEFEHMKQAAGVFTVMEQMQMQQQQAQQQADQQAKTQQATFEHETKMAKAQAKPTEFEIHRDPTGRAAKLKAVA